ncbi:MAG TPA: CHAT domain-containing protein [Kofleriaceae bacterium]|nr:CHAT domain-containing protein [Kofleriaceae bacterium]
MIVVPKLARVWLAAVLVVQAAACRAPRSDCVQHRAAHAWIPALVSCVAELGQTRDPARALDAATAASYLQRPRDALRLAAGATSPDAHYLIGAAQFALGELAPAASHLEVAATLHALAGDAHAEARDRQQLAGVAFQRGDYRDALAAEELARAAALRDHDDRMVVLLDVARADILRRLGDFRGAERAIDQALAAARAPADRVAALLKRGMLYLDEGNPPLAREPFTRALDEARAAALPDGELIEALHENLSYVERKARAFPRALDEMERARQAGAGEPAYRLNRGLVRADMGELASAAEDLAAAEAAPLDGEGAWWVPLQRARVAARQHDAATAIAEDRRAIAQVTALAARAGWLAPTMIAHRREPHLHLIGLLAHDQRWTDILDVVATLDGQALLDSSEPASDLAPPHDGSLPGRARPAPPPGAAARVLDAWRGRRLVIVVPGGDRVWRLDVHDGEIAGSDAGDAAALAELAHTLERTPGDAGTGRALGAALLGPRLPPGARIALLAIGPLARAPLAALQTADGPAIARYQLVRAPGVLPRTPARRADAASIVIGDPTGDLPAAAAEARQVAAQLHADLLIGGAATRAAFARAAGADVLHIAAHTTLRPEGETLELADGPIAAADIAGLGRAPRLVVLASCSTAAGRDDAGNGSLASAFLDAGAELVVATRWSVGDAEAAQLIRAFYAAGGAGDPVRALAEAQLASPLPATTWAAFEVLGARPAR